MVAEPVHKWKETEGLAYCKYEFGR